MTRARKLTDPDIQLELDADPVPDAPRRGPGRPRKTTPAGTRGPGRIPVRDSATGRIKSKAEMIRDVREDIATYLRLANGAFSLRDPECSEAIEDHIDDVATRLVAVLGRNEKLLARMATTSMIGDLVALLTAVTPVVRVLWQVHGPNGTGHAPAEEIDASSYPAYSRAA